MPQMWPMYWENLFLLSILLMSLLMSKFMFFYKSKSSINCMLKMKKNMIINKW